MTVLTKTFDAPNINRREVLRYAKARECEELSSLVDSVIKEAEGAFTYKVCYTELEVQVSESGVDFSFFTAKSKSLAKNLNGCTRAIVFGATVGLGIDRLVAKYSRTSPSRALILNALGAERIEALCDEFCKSIKEEYGAELCPRFSPGYADLPLDFQKEIFNLLDLPKRAGITLTDTMLMSPTKSVTAIIGIRK